MNRPAPMTPAMEIIVMCRGLRPVLRGEAGACVSISGRGHRLRLVGYLRSHWQNGDRDLAHSDNRVHLFTATLEIVTKALSGGKPQRSATKSCLLYTSDAADEE